MLNSTKSLVSKEATAYLQNKKEEEREREGGGVGVGSNRSSVLLINSFCIKTFGYKNVIS